MAEECQRRDIDLADIAAWHRDYASHYNQGHDNIMLKDGLISRSLRRRAQEYARLSDMHLEFAARITIC